MEHRGWYDVSTHYELCRGEIVLVKNIQVYPKSSCGRESVVEKIYKRIYEAFEGKTFRYCRKEYNKDFVFNELAHFIPVCGESYFNATNKNGKKLRVMLVGRATNGWGNIEASNADEFAEKMKKRLKESNFDWIEVDDTNKLFSPSTSENQTDYLISRSPFWRTARNIWIGLGGVSKTNEPKWMENIVWSNLYKIAPKDVPKGKVGNPTAKMRNVQHMLCKELLQEEIEFYKPTHILLVTGLDWISWYGKDSFLSIFEQPVNNGDEYAIGSTWYKFNNGHRIPVVITRRPEFCKEKNFVDAVLKSFKQML